MLILVIVLQVLIVVVLRLTLIRRPFQLIVRREGVNVLDAGCQFVRRVWTQGQSFRHGGGSQFSQQLLLQTHDWRLDQQRQDQPHDIGEDPVR